MDTKCMGVLSFISIFLLINGQTGVLENLPKQQIESAIYYGDSNVYIGQPFKITCIVPIFEPINWIKDGKPITEHNLRHWRDEHSFITSESPIDGERHRIEAHISVRHALKAHQGRYQCNTLHSSYHMLKIHDIKKAFTRLNGVDYLDVSVPTLLPEVSTPNDDIYTTGGSTIQQFILPHASAPATSNENKELPIQTIINVYPNNTKFNSMHAVTGQVPSMIWRSTTSDQQHDDFFNKNNITGVVLVHPFAFPINREFVQITDKEINQLTPTKPIPSMQYNLTALPGFIPITNPTTILNPIRNEPDLLVPNYDNVENRLKAFSIRTPLVLSCNITKKGDYDLIWEKEGTEVSKVPFLQGRYRIIKPERKFIIEKTDEKDAGTYACRVNDEKREIVVVANVVVRVPSNTGVVEGERLSIHCIVVGTDPELYWEAANLTLYNSSGRYILKEDGNHVQNAILNVENISLDDRGEYKCLARNIVTKLGINDPASDASYVRVKGKLAALWPFLGICAEVLILCTIILIYEKRRNKTELEESDTDPNTEQ